MLKWIIWIMIKSNYKDIGKRNIEKEAMIRNLSRSSKELIRRMLHAGRTDRLFDRNTKRHRLRLFSEYIQNFRDTVHITPGIEWSLTSGIWNEETKNSLQKHHDRRERRKFKFNTVLGNGRNWYNKSCKYFYKKWEKKVDAWFTTQQVL